MAIGRLLGAAGPVCVCNAGPANEIALAETARAMGMQA